MFLWIINIDNATVPFHLLLNTLTPLHRITPMDQTTIPIYYYVLNISY